MRALIGTEFITLDEAAPGGEPTHPHSGWVIPDVTSGLHLAKLHERRDAG